MGFTFRSSGAPRIQPFVRTFPLDDFQVQHTRAPLDYEGTVGGDNMKRSMTGKGKTGGWTVTRGKLMGNEESPLF